MNLLAQKILSLLLSLIMVPSVFSVSDKPLIGPKKFDVTVDAKTAELCEIVRENSYLDIVNTVTNLRDVSAPVKLLNKALPFDCSAFSEIMYKLRDKCYEDDKITLGKAFYLIGAYFRGFESCDIKLSPCGDGTYEFLMYVTYSDGETDVLHSGAYYNPETGLFYGKDEKGMFDIGYNFDINDMVIYATLNCWMRDFGFCFEYDILSYITPLYYYHTRRFKFYYEGKEWMIQAWKGMYVAANGAEIGVYNRLPSPGTFYNCVSDEDMLNMSFSLYHGNELLFTREMQKSWWINGFQLSKELYSANELTLKFTIEMKDEKMLKAFCKAVDLNLHRDVAYKADGLTVSLEW